MRRVVPLVACAFACAGCDIVFGIDRLAPPADAAPCSTPIGHDEDHDGLDDSCDPCPFDADNAHDADGDGIGDACDPDPGAPDEVVVFSGFDAATRSQFTVTDGEFGSDAYRATGVGDASLIWNGDPDGTWLVAGFDVESLEDTSYREVGLVFDAAVNESNQLNGTLCVLGRDSNQNGYVEVFGRQRPDGDIPVNHTDVELPLETFHGVVRASYRRGGLPAVSCSFTAGDDSEATITGTRDTPPARGALALYAMDTTVSFRFLFVVRRR